MTRKFLIKELSQATMHVTVADPGFPRVQPSLPPLPIIDHIEVEVGGGGGQLHCICGNFH